MKNLKKTFAVVLTIAMLVTLFMVPVVADEMTAAEKLETLNVLVGGGSGVTPEYLAGPATKLTSAILLLKLKGMEADAKVWDGTENFDDADQALSLYAQAIMGYLKENPALGFEGYMNMLDPYAVISAQMYYKVLLTALGYEQGVDFEWADTIAFAETIGLMAIADVEELTIEDFAVATVEALDTEVKGTGMTLIEKLVDDGVVAAEDAEAAGWSFAPAIVSAMQTAGNKVTVTFSTAVDDAAAVLKIKQGVVIWYSTVAWNATKDVATLTTVSVLPAGTYTVEVTGLGDVMTKDFTSTLAVASSIAITTPMIYANSTEIEYAVYDQFGVAMTTGAAIGTAYNQTDAAAITLAPSGTTKFTFAAQTKDDVVVFTVIYNGLTASKSFAVQANPAPSTMGFGTVMPLTGKAYIFPTDAGLVVPYTLYDQYGNAKLLPTYVAGADGVANQETIDNILFVSSNIAAVNPDSFAVSSTGVLTFTAGAAGTAIVMAYMNAMPIGQFSVTVSADSAPTTAMISAPAVLIAAGESVSLDLVIKDQYGTTLDNSTVMGSLTIDDTNCTAVINAATDKLDISATAVGTAKVDILVGTTVIGTVSFTVYAAAVASSITGVSTPMLFQVGASDTLAIADVMVVDQYGRAFTPATITLSEVTDPSSAITVGANAITAVAVGTATVSVLADAGPTFGYTVSVIAVADVVSYTMSPLGSIHTGGADYYATPVLIGKDASNNSVVLASAGYDLLTSSNLAVADIVTLEVRGLTVGTSTISAYMGGVLRASGTITVTDEALVATTVTVATTALTTASVTSVVTVKDQYGVAMAKDGVYYVDDVLTSGATLFSALGGADTYVVKYIAPNGAMGSGSVVVS